jgi:protein-disulfide isomerase
MKRGRLNRIALWIALPFLSVVACSKDKPPPSSASVSTTSGASEPSPDTVVATINGQAITYAQLEDQLKNQMRDLDEQYQRQKAQMRRQGLDQMITRRLVQAEAAKKGMTDEQYLKAEIDDKVPAPSEQKVKEFFDQNAAQLPPGSKLEDFRVRIVEVLTRSQKQERAKALFDQLRKDNKVAVKLSEPRKTVDAKGPSRGPSNAPVTVVEFSDFQCPYCGRARDTIEQMMQEYAGKVRLVFREFPLDFHKNAKKAAEAALCANDQGKFWEYHDLLFKNQQKLEVPQLKEHASATGLDSAKFTGCLDSGQHTKDVEADMAAGQKLGVPGTPTVFVNGILLSSASMDEFKRVIDEELSAK